MFDYILTFPLSIRVIQSFCIEMIVIQDCAAAFPRCRTSAAYSPYPPVIKMTTGYYVFPCSNQGRTGTCLPPATRSANVHKSQLTGLGPLPPHLPHGSEALNSGLVPKHSHLDNITAKSTTTPPQRIKPFISAGNAPCTSLPGRLYSGYEQRYTS
jgi:hypothetical protein